MIGPIQRLGAPPSKSGAAGSNANPASVHEPEEQDADGPDGGDHLLLAGALVWGGGELFVSHDAQRPRVFRLLLVMVRFCAMAVRLVAKPLRRATTGLPPRARSAGASPEGQRHGGHLEIEDGVVEISLVLAMSE